MAKPAKDRKKGTPVRDPATAVNPRAFRRTFATWMQRTGATVKDVQGAMRHYTRPNPKVYMREIPTASGTPSTPSTSFTARSAGWLPMRRVCNRSVGSSQPSARQFI